MWLWAYLASIIPGMMLCAFVAGRMKLPKQIAAQLAIVTGAMWPFLLPVYGLVWLVERCVERGGSHAEVEQ